MGDQDYLNALSRFLSDDDTLWSMVDGQIYTDYSDTQVLDALTSTHKTLIGITIIDDTGSGRLGAAYHGIMENDVIFSIDVASIYGNSAAYCRQVCSYIKDLVFKGVEKTLGGVTYQIMVTKVNVHVYYDDDAKYYHGVVTVTGEYRRTVT